MAIALLVYCNTADAARARNSSTTFMLPASLRSGERSNIEFWDGRGDHWKEDEGGGEEDTLGVLEGAATGGGGTKAQALEGSL